MAVEDDPDVPRRFGKLTLLKRIGAGGMGEVHLARQRGPRDVRRQVVVKRLRPELAAEPRFIERFFEEARVSVRLSHPNVVQTFEFGEVEGIYFLTLEYVQGIDLATLCPLLNKLGARCPLDVALEAIMQAASGLHYVHSLQDFNGRPMHLVHRDVSPSNLMISDSGHVKLLDFGVAGRLEPAKPEAIVGKAPYLAPEQVKRETLDARTDLFSLGIVLWELLAGRQLFRRGSDPATLLAVVQDVVQPPSELRPKIPPGVDRIVASLLEKERTRRYSSAESLQTEIEKVVAQHHLRAGPRLLRNFLESLRSLPTSREDIPYVDTAPESRPLAPPPLPTVLVVDDDEPNLQLIQRVLRRDCRLVACSSAEEALEVILREHVDVLLTDARMPGMSGLELVKRARVVRPSMRRIIVSAYADPTTLLEAINDGGIQRYILKPWEANELRAVVAEAIRQARLASYVDPASLSLKTLELPQESQPGGAKPPTDPRHDA